MKIADCVVVIDYTNYRGERRERRIHPAGITFSCSEHHPENQWLLIALDLEKDEMRLFAMKDVHSWRPDV